MFLHFGSGYSLTSLEKGEVWQNRVAEKYLHNAERAIQVNGGFYHDDEIHSARVLEEVMDVFPDNPLGPFKKDMLIRLAHISNGASGVVLAQALERFRQDIEQREEQLRQINHKNNQVFDQAKGLRGVQRQLFFSRIKSLVRLRRNVFAPVINGQIRAFPYSIDAFESSSRITIGQIFARPYSQFTRRYLGDHLGFGRPVADDENLKVLLEQKDYRGADRLVKSIINQLNTAYFEYGLWYVKPSGRISS
jgi:uncharacterized protein (UPF0335 family)